jgi:hypothetical protein
MATLDELRRTLAENAQTAPPRAGLLDEVEAGVSRIRRRRRVAATLTAAALVLVAAVAVPVVVRRSATPAVPASTQSRGDTDVTLSMRPGSAYALKVKGGGTGINGSAQFLYVRYSANVSGCCAVRVWDPGSYDAKALQKANQITVNGHRAWAGLIPVTGRQQMPDVVKLTLPVVGWREPTGAWVTVWGEQNDKLEYVRNVAADVRVGPPHPATVPFHFTVPHQLRVSYVAPPTGANHGGAVALWQFGGTREPTIDLTFGTFGPYLPGPLTVTAFKAKGPWSDYTNANTPPTETIAGHKVWYYEGTAPKINVRPPGSVMLVEIGDCGLQIETSDKTRITKADLTALVGTLRVDDCGKPATWRPF